MLDSQPSPRGGERATAVHLRDWAARRWPKIVWRVQELGDSANLIASHARPGPLLYSHLDTSMDGSARDALVTGVETPIGSLRVRADEVDGFALTVARAPAAAALVAFAHADAGTLLLAGSGTHRKSGTRPGVLAYLESHPTPSAAIVAKSGPPGILWEEPGAAYLRVRVTGRSGAAVLPGTAMPRGGLIEHLGPIVAAIGRWRTAHLAKSAARTDLGQMAAECGIGSVQSGWEDKPDLLPGLVDLGLYLVTVPGDDAVALGAGLQRTLCDALPGTPLVGCGVTVDVDVVDEPARTRSDAAIVRAARDAWITQFGAAPAPVVWSGSTDGVVLRAAGIDTVRLGPTGRPAVDDPRRDVFDLSALTQFGGIYRSLLNG